MIFHNVLREKDYKKNSKNMQIILLIITIIAFIGVLYCSIFCKDSYPLGFFVGLFSVMVLSLVKLIICSKNDQKMKSEYINRHDERNVLIMQQASQITIIFSIVGIGIASLICSLFDMKIAMSLCITSISIVAVLLISIFVIKHKS